MMFVFFLMPFGMIIQLLRKIKSARAVVLALPLLSMICLFVRAVLLPQRFISR